MTAPTSGPSQRAAVAALDAARPLVARLDISRDPEDLAADIIEAWNQVETSLRSLVGASALTGQALIRELRQREMLSLDTAHSLLEFQAARDRVQRTDYRPTTSDIAATREGFRSLERVILGPPLGANPVAPATEASPGPPIYAGEPTTVPPMRRARPTFGAPVIAGIALLVAAALFGGWYLMSHRGNASLERGAQYYQEHKFEAAKGEFTKAARDNPELALPHVYLGRMAREENDYMTANRELQTAVRLEPNSALGQREMAALLLATGNAELARRFYVRAVQLDPNDRNAQGYLGCTLLRLGRLEEGQRFLARAGAGPWNACAPSAQPGMQQMQPTMPMQNP